MAQIADPIAAAKAARLRYVTNQQAGIRRLGEGKDARYIDDKGRPVTDAATLERIRALGIPPAWTDVWICPQPTGHLQATGRDAKGRKQYRYHPRWRETRDETKYGRMIAFGQALPQIRRAVELDLGRPGLPREKVLAAVVRLLETTLIRVGNEEYARSNSSYGLTTMRDKHVTVDAGRITFQFRGKSGKQHRITLSDRRLARVVQRCRDLPGQELFQYLDDDGARQSISSHDVNDYLREVAGQEFSAKDFRTWAGTVLAAQALHELGIFESQTQGKKNIVQAIEAVAARLGNTPAICRKCYVHPTVLEAYLDGSLAETLRQRADEALDDAQAELPPHELEVLRFLRKRMG
jgi:DNA topoisomerase I